MGGSGWEMGCASERRIRLVSGFWISVPCKTHTLLIIEHSSKEEISGPGRRNLPQRSGPILPAPSMCPLPTAANPPQSACLEPFKGSSVLIPCSGLNKIGSRRAGQEMLISQMFSSILPAPPPSNPNPAPSGRSRTGPEQHRVCLLFSLLPISSYPSCQAGLWVGSGPEPGAMKIWEWYHLPQKGGQAKGRD